MNRWWLLGGLIVLTMAGLVGWLNAGNEARLYEVPILADVTTAGCDAAGQLHLRIGNASGRTIARLEGVLSVVAPDGGSPTPIGNFELDTAITGGALEQACVTVDETALAGSDRDSLMWLARATRVEFAD